MKHCETPWTLTESGPSGLEISAPVDLVEFVEWSHKSGKPMPVVWRTGPQMAKIATERWVQFAPQGWDAMQKANFEFMVKAVNAHDHLVAACEQLISQLKLVAIDDHEWAAIRDGECAIKNNTH